MRELRKIPAGRGGVADQRPGAKDPWSVLQSSIGNRAVQRLVKGGLQQLMSDAMNTARAAGGISADVLGAMAAIQGSQTMTERIRKTLGASPTSDVLAAALAAQAGLRTEIELTDVAFKVRHPDRATRKLVPGDPADADLISEWVEIRRTTIRPMLAKMGIVPIGGKGGQAKKTGGLLTGMFGSAAGKAQRTPNMKEQIIEGLKVLDSVLGVTETLEKMGAQLNSERLIVMSLLAQGVTDEITLMRVVYATRHPGTPPRKSKSRSAELRAILATVVRPAIAQYHLRVVSKLLKGLGGKQKAG